MCDISMLYVPPLICVYGYSRLFNISPTIDTGSVDEVFYLRIWTINGKLVRRVSSKVQIKCLQYTSAPEGVYINVLVGGLTNGNIK